MSKRSRDDASIASLKAVLGDIPIHVIENLLHRSNNNVEAAVNLYFSQPQPVDPPAPKPKSQSESTLTKSSNGIRYYIGEMVLTGWSLVKGVSPVKEGDTIIIVRDKVRSSTNKIVRFATIQGREIGRVSSEVASFIAILMDQQLCQFEAAIVWSPNVLKIGEDMILTIKCYMSPMAMHTNSFMSHMIPQAKKKSNNEKLIQEVPVMRKLALLQMFQTLGLKPVRSAIQRMNMGGDTPYDMIIQTINTKDDDTSNEKTEEALGDEDDDEKKKEVTDDQLDTIYEKAQVFDSQITPMEQPETMALELKEYQKRALAWMTAKEALEYDDGDIDMRSMHPLWEEYSFPGEFADEHRFFYFNPYSGELSLEFPEANSQEKGGILADEMGLGKTIEILSLIHANRCRFDIPQQIPKASDKRKYSPTTIIVCPMSLLAQWRDEIIRGSKPDTITVELYYGGDRSNSLTNRLCRWDGSAPDVLITTYGVLMNEWTKKNDIISPSSLYKIEFWRIVLDEAHQIKNRLTKTSHACRDIHAKRRWAVTGTPIQNKLDDLYSLVRFLRHEPWANHTFWKTFITVPFEKKDPRALSAVQTVLEPIVLRRTKAMRDRQGKPMVPLPPKTINIEYLAFSPEEQDIYDAIYNDSQVKFSYYCQAGQVGRNYASIFQLLTRLRQICCHPYLALQSKDASKQEVSGKGMTLEELIAHKSSQEMSQNTSSEISASSYGLSVLQNMLAKQQNGSTPTQEDDDAPAIPDECPICFESVESVIVMPCMHMACRPCAMDYFQKKEDEGTAGECPVCRYGPILQSQLLEFAQQTPEEQEEELAPSKEMVTKQTKKKVRFDIRKAVGGLKPSTKISALVKHLKQNRKEGLKTVVFSQFTSFLDLIGQALEYESIEFTRLDGTQAQAQREKVLAAFSKPDETGAGVLLISLRAGGVGLNLTCANRIVMMDPWWNFAIESQAIDRVHRLGQSKEVTVTRFVMKDTVEERILEIQNRKHVLVNELYMSRDESKNRKMDDLQLLFSKRRKL